jgi:hypothetical protein
MNDINFRVDRIIHKNFKEIAIHFKDNIECKID